MYALPRGPSKIVASTRRTGAVSFIFSLLILISSPIFIFRETRPSWKFYFNLCGFVFRSNKTWCWWKTNRANCQWNEVSYVSCLCLLTFCSRLECIVVMHLIWPSHCLKMLIVQTCALKAPCAFVTLKARVQGDLYFVMGQTEQSTWWIHMVMVDKNKPTKQ